MDRHSTRGIIMFRTPIAVVVTVEPTPVISSPNKTICDNTSTAITVSTSTTTSNPTYYTWTVSGVGANITGASNGPANGTALGTALAQTLDNTGSTAQTVTYNITPRTGTAPGSIIMFRDTNSSSCNRRAHTGSNYCQLSCCNLFSGKCKYQYYIALNYHKSTSV